MLTLHAARTLTLAAWMMLPPTQRRSGYQATAFAGELAKLFPFDTSHDRATVMLGWLSPHLPKVSEKLR